MRGNRRSIVRPLTRALRMLFVALMVGGGGGLGGLGSGLRKIEKPEPDNAVTCVAEESIERE